MSRYVTCWFIFAVQNKCHWAIAQTDLVWYPLVTMVTTGTFFALEHKAVCSWKQMQPSFKLRYLR